MSGLPRTSEYEHTSWSEDDPLCAQLKRRSDAMRDELLARIAELEAGLSIEQKETRRLGGRLKQAKAALAEMNSHGPEGHNVTNQQYVDERDRAEKAEAALADVEEFLASRGLLSSYRADLRARAAEESDRIWDGPEQFTEINI